MNSRNNAVMTIVKDAFNNTPELTFYEINSKGKVEFFSNQFILFLEKQGFRTIKTGNNVELVRIEGNIVSKITPSDIKQFIITHLEGQTDILDYIINRTGLFSLNYLDALQPITLKMLRDTSTSSFFPYKNGIVEVTKDEIKKPIPYSEGKQLIWKDHIIDRDFNTDTDIIKDIPIFQDFVDKLANNDPDRIKRLNTIIGYCLNDFRNTANTKAVIINDEVVSDQPEGGSGKSLLVQALGQIRKTLNLDGKKFDPKHEFAWQNVDESIKIAHIDDAARGFLFEDLFSTITSGFIINRKNKEQYVLPVGTSPILVITTNTIMKGNSGSFARRQYSVDIHPYFSNNHSPLEEYVCIFFTEWDNFEWNLFDMFMMQCVQMYLRSGVTKCKEINSCKKDAIRATCISFVEWIEEAKDDYTSLDGITTNGAKEQFINASGQKWINLSDKKFLTWIQEYCKIYNMEFIKLDKQRPRGFRLVINK